jgi:uncharacterized membrane protein
MRERISALFAAVAALAATLQGGSARGGGYTYITLDDPNANHGTFAAGINDAGAVVGHYVTGFVNQGFLYQGGQFTTVQVDGGNATPTSINDAGTIAGFYADSAGLHGFTLTSGGNLTTIDDPNAVHGTEATGINNKGDVVGFYYDSAFTAHGFSLINGMFSTIDYTGAGTGPGAGTFAQGINDADRIVGGVIGGSSGNVGFTYDGTSFTKLTVPGSSTTFGAGINDAGALVGYFNDSAGQHGFVDMGGQFTTLDDPNAALGTRAAGINASGTIVGYYEDIGAVAHGFVAVAQVPEPGTMTLAALGALSILAARLGRAPRKAGPGTRGSTGDAARH